MVRQPSRRQYGIKEFPQDFAVSSMLPCFHPEERLSFAPRRRIQIAIEILTAMPGKHNGTAWPPEPRDRARLQLENEKNAETQRHGDGEVSNSPNPLFLCASATLCFKSGE
jgi:hypothetical protein